MGDARDGNIWQSIAAEPETDDELTVTSLRAKPAVVSSAARSLRWHLWYRLGAGVLLVALLFVGVIAVAHPSLADLPFLPKPVPDPLVLKLTRMDVSCGQNAQGVWSPDGTRIALISTSFGCGNASQTSGPPSVSRLAVFDATTGRETSHVDLTAIIVAQVVPALVRGSPLLLSELDVGLLLPMWSPDGTTLATVFFASPQIPSTGNQPPASYGQGLLLVNVATGKGRVLKLPSGKDIFSSIGVQSNAFGPISAPRWNLDTGAMDSISLQPALAYRWEKNGTVSAVQPLPTTPNAAPPPTQAGPIGNPIGGASFTIWQTGNINYNVSSGCPQNGTQPTTVASYNADDYYQVTLTTPAWSPDGRYILLFAEANVRLPPRPAPPVSTPAAPSQTTGYVSCTDAGPSSQVAQIPLRDAGLRAALSLISLNTQPSISVAWRPDGKRLAVAPEYFTASPDSIASDVPVLLIYDCVTSHVRARFTMGDIERLAVNGPLASGSPLMQTVWSPDGTRLLALPSGPYGAPVVFGPKSLGG